MALASNLSHLAIGLGDGTVLLYRHLLQSLTTSPTALTSLPKARVVLEPNERAPEAITGLGFRESHSQRHGPNATTLFIVTTNRVLAAQVSAKGGEARVLDEIGCGLDCASMDWERQNMVVARDEAIYLYSPEGRGACYAYDGRKISAFVSKHNLIITSPSVPTAAARRQMPRGAIDDSADAAKITIFDLENKIVAYSGVFRNGIKAIFSQWGSVFIFEGNGQVRFAFESIADSSFRSWRNMRPRQSWMCCTSATSTRLLLDWRSRKGWPTLA